VYAASEGLSVVVLDARAFGGQAGASARIENYLGFPTGISGEALAGRAFTQAQKFGAVMAIPAAVQLLKHAPPDPQAAAIRFELEIEADRPVRATTIVVASGAIYRKPDLPNLGQFEGHGVYYWASPIESKLCAQREVVVVGGGNSAGQGTVYLADHVARVHLLVRGPSLAENMSQYLVDRITALPNVEVHLSTELSRLIGDPPEGLRAVCWRQLDTGVEEKREIRHLFLFIGAEPNTAWLRRCAVRLDEKGFVLTGLSADANGNEDRRCMQHETSLHGVFAAGDVRAGSVKRVSAAVGEGAALVAQLHDYLRGIRATGVRSADRRAETRSPSVAGGSQPASRGACTGRCRR
jgi:thioredoxin reductase (NADPH)